MQEVKKENEQIKDIIFLLKKVYGKRITIEKRNQLEYEVQLDDQKQIIRQYETFCNLLKQSLDLRNLKTKKEIYNQLLKLAQLYLKDAKEKRSILKEIIPSIDKIVSSFFDVSKYGTDEHIFDDFCIKNMTYEQLLVIFPKMLSNLKQRKKEEKKYILETIFNDCQTLEDTYKKIEYLKKNEKAYQEELSIVYPNYQDFFKYYQVSHKELGNQNLIFPVTYHSLYHLFLMKTIEIKEQELGQEDKEYHTLLVQYQEMNKQIRILEIEPEFEDIKKMEQKLTQEEKILLEEEKKEKKHYHEKEEQLSKITQERNHLLEKNIFLRFLKQKEIHTLDNSLLEYTKEKETLEKQLHQLKTQAKKLKKGLCNNEEKLKTLCGFDISIKEYEEKRSELKDKITLEELKEVVTNLEDSLMKYHLEKKEEELASIYTKNQLPLPKEYKQITEKVV